MPQAGIGYQLLRWGRLNDDEEAVEKGLGILNFWAEHTMTDAGFPRLWVHLSAHQSEPQPLWVRQIVDGLEAVLDAYVFEKKRGILHESWLHVYQGFEYRGGPCDTSDIMDKESGIALL